MLVIINKTQYNYTVYLTQYETNDQLKNENKNSLIFNINVRL